MQQKQLKLEPERQRGNLLREGTQSDQEARRALGEAGRAMELATEDLEKGSLPGALDNQSKAIDALREGMRRLGGTFAERQPYTQGANPNDQSSNNETQDRTSQELLGRDTGGNGQVGSGEQMMLQEALRLRSQQLMEEIRRRSGALDRPEDEHGYLQKLLDRF